MLKQRARAGISLVELVVVLAILGVAAGSVMRIGVRQQRAYGSLAARTLALAQLRAGADVLTSELAGIAPAAGDIHEDGMRRSAIEYRAPLASVVLCTPVDANASEIVVASLRSLMGSLDTLGTDAEPGEGWLGVGDSIWIHDIAADTAGAPPGTVWPAFVVTSTAGSASACTAPGGVPIRAIRATLGRPIGRVLEPYAPGRVFRAVRYGLYRAADGDWYLGFSDCRPLVRTPACAPQQPVAGPFLPDVTSRPAAGGLAVEYLDAHGAPTDDRFAVAAIRLTLRAAPVRAGVRGDTLTVTRTVAFRNAQR